MRPLSRSTKSKTGLPCIWSRAKAPQPPPVELTSNQFQVLPEPAVELVEQAELEVQALVVWEAWEA